MRYGRNQVMATFRSFVISAILAGLLVSCSGKTNSDEEAIWYLSKSVESSQITTKKYTQWILMALKEKLNDPASAQRTAIWYPKALQVQAYSNAVIEDLEKIEKKFSSFSNQYKYLDEIPDQSKDIAYLTRILKFYNRNILAIDPAIDTSFSSREDLGSPDTLNSRLYPVYLFSRRITIDLAVCLINQFENNIRIIENRMIQFANNKTAIIVGSLESYSALVGITANRTGPGAKLKIIAGVGAFRKSVNAKISVDRKLYPLSEDGTLLYEFNAPTTPGKFKKRVKIEFMDEYGKMEAVERDIDYTVVP